MSKITGSNQADALIPAPFGNIGQSQFLTATAGIFGMDMEIGDNFHITNILTSLDFLSNIKTEETSSPVKKVRYLLGHNHM